MADYALRNVFEGSYYIYKDNPDAHIALYNRSFSTEDKLKLSRLYRSSLHLSDLIESVYFVNPIASVACVSDGTINCLDTFEDTAAFTLFAEDIKNVLDVRSLPDGKQVVSFCFSNTRFGDSTLFGGMIVNLDAEKVWDIFNGHEGEDNPIWLVTKTGQMLSGMQEGDAGIAPDAALPAIIDGASNETQHIACALGGQDVLVVYQKASIFGLRFVGLWGGRSC